MRLPRRQLTEPPAQPHLPQRRRISRGGFPLSIFRQLFFAAVLALAATPALAQGGPPAMPVGVAEPLAKRVTQWDEYSGRFEAVASVEVRARVSGFIDKLHFRDGQLVKVGDLLFTIDKRPFEIAVESAAAEVARTKAQVELAEAQVDRGASLIGSRTITDAGVRPAQGQPQRRARPAQGRRGRPASTAELNLEWTEVRAPLAGRISDRKVDAGNLIAGGQTGATLLATIVTLDPIHFIFDVSEADYLRYPRLHPVRRAAARDAPSPVRIRLSDETEWTRDRQGRLRRQHARAPAPARIRARAIVENKDQLLTPGIFGRLQLFGGEYDALLVPDQRHRLRPGAQDRVHGRRRRTSCGAKPVVLGRWSTACASCARAWRRPTRSCSTGSPIRWCGRAPRSRRRRARSKPPASAGHPLGRRMIRFSHFFIDRPIFATVLSIIILIVGLHRPARAAGRRISRDRAADGQHHRDLSRRLGRGHRRRPSPRRSSRRSTASTTCSTSPRSRPATGGCRSTSSSSPASTSTRRRCWCRTASRSPSRACPRTCSASASSSARPRPT